MKLLVVPWALALVASTSALNAAPLITSQPQADQRVIAGSFADFFVAATGAGPLTYRWKKNGANLSDNARISGATTDYLLIQDLIASDSATYTVVVTDTNGASTTSSNAVLTVLVPPTITTQPQNQTVIAGESVTFSVRASGTAPLDYQWYQDFSEIPGATNQDFTLTNVSPLDAGEYYVQVNNETQEPANSDTVTLTVNVPPIILEHPEDQTVVEGDEYVDFSVDIDPSSTTPLSFLWYRNDNLITGASDSTYTIVHLDNGEDYAVRPSDAGTYHVRVSNGIGPWISSEKAVLTVLVPPKIASQSASKTAWTNTTATFWVKVDSTTTQPVSYQWYYEAEPGGASWPEPIAGATATNLTVLVTNMNQYGSYTCELSNLVDTLFTEDAILTVKQESNPPFVDAVSPPDYAIWTEPVITVRGTASDNGGVRVVQYFTGGAAVDYSITNIPATSDGWTNWVASFDALMGTNRFVARAYDTSGNWDTDYTLRIIRVVSDQVTLVTNPVAGGSISGVTNGQWLAINTNYTVTATANTAQGYAFANWVLTTNGTDWATSTTPALTFTMQSNLTIRANFADVANPTNTVTHPTVGQVLVSVSNYLRGAAQDNASIAEVRYQLNGGAWSPAATTNGWTNWLASVTLLPGANTLKAYAVDSSGNCSPTSSVAFAVKFFLGVSNDLRLSLDASPSFNYRVDMSTNLRHWEFLTNIASPTMPFYFLDPGATRTNRIPRFYRAIAQ